MVYVISVHICRVSADVPTAGSCREGFEKCRRVLDSEQVTLEARDQVLSWRLQGHFSSEVSSLVSVPDNVRDPVGSQKHKSDAFQSRATVAQSHHLGAES